MSTLSNATAVLRLFSAERVEVSVSEVSRLLGMAKSSASRLLRAMQQEGLLSVRGSPPRYRVGNLLFEIARLHLTGSTLVTLADEALLELCRTTGHTGYISILDGSDVLVIKFHHGSNALRVVTPLGSRAAAFATSTGRVLLARLSDEEVRSLHPERLTAPSKNSPRSMRQLLANLDEVRRTGCAVAVDEAIPDVGSVAASVVDPAHGERIAFCLSYSASLVGETETRRIVRLITEAAREIGRKIGDPYWLGRQAAVAA
jgi:IclR family transcriptional regulator, KDG regulon repressor